MKVTFEQTKGVDDIFFRGNILISKSIQDHTTIVMVTGAGHNCSTFAGTELYHSRNYAATPGVNGTCWAKDTFIQFTGKLTLEP